MMTTPDLLRVSDPVAPWQHVRPLGEDIVATELVLPENHRVTPADLGACAAAGLSSIPVRRRPVVTIIPTGNELTPFNAPRKPGDIPEFNSLILSGMVREWGGEPAVSAPVPDDLQRHTPGRFRRPGFQRRGGDQRRVLRRGRGLHGVGD